MEPIGDIKYSYKTTIEMLDGFFNKEIPQFNLSSVCGKLFYKDLFNTLRFPVGRLFEDEFITYRLYYSVSQVVFVNAVLYYYYDNMDGITRSLTIQKRFDEYDAQWERLIFFREKQLDELYNKALMNFLQTAQWDLIACRKKREFVEEKRVHKFKWQYNEVFEEARKRNILNFIDNYDFYVLAKPQMVLWWRIKRQIIIKILDFK